MYEVRREVHTANTKTTLNEVDNLKQLYSSSLGSLFHELQVLATFYANAVVYGKYRSPVLEVCYETGLRTKE